MGKIISIINQKGGVGKTTTSINLAYGLSLENKSVLLIDLDPQGHSTMGIGIEPGTFKYSINNVLLDHLDIKDAIINKFKNLDVVPSNIRLDNCEQLLSPQLFKESRLKNALNDLSYDYIIIDCRPSLGTLTINALYACDFIIVPCEVSKYSLDGLADLLETVQNVKDRQYETFKKNIKILLTKFDSRKGITNDWVLGELEKENFLNMLLKTRIRQNEPLNQAHIAMEPVSKHKESSSGSIDYLSLTKEIITYE
jgi:chromosome partitioning protein